MTVSISDFLAPNVTPAENVQVKLDRFKSPFEIRALSQSEADMIRKANMRREKTKIGTSSQLDQNAYVDGLILASVVVPNLNDAELQKSYGTPGKPLDTLRTMLLAGEYSTLGEKVQEVSGFDEDSVDDVSDEVKK